MQEGSCGTSSQFVFRRQKPSIFKIRLEILLFNKAYSQSWTSNNVFDVKIMKSEKKNLLVINIISVGHTNLWLGLKFALEIVLTPILMS